MSAPEQIEQWYDEHAQALFAFVLNLTRNEADTQDVLQEVFIKLAQRPALFNDVRDARAFLLQLAHNQAIDLLRRRGTREKAGERLERHRLAHGGYPETLDALVPQYLEKVPHDIIGGRPLKYSRTPEGKYHLYSIGWNEKDDGGIPGASDTEGDWVWE